MQKANRWNAVAALWIAALFLGCPGRAQTESELAIRPTGETQVQLTWTPGTNFNVLQQTPELTPTNSWLDVPDAPEVLGTRFSVFRPLTNGAAFYRLVSRGTPGISTPPNPAEVAPPPNPNVYNDLVSLTAFLYTGSNAVQVGVNPGTISSARAAVLRGQVLQRDNRPLPGVRVAILSHPEFGYTYSRTDGKYDLVVNAATYTVDFQAIGYCPAQRQVTVSALAFGAAPDVILVPQDVAATSVLFGSNSPLQVATSSPQTDAAGTRSATMLIPAGTTATLVMPDGSAQPVNSLTIRVTELTVGTNGPKAMPAALPPNSGYTYCADFSSDEALNAGATSVQFSQPVPVYVDNFLGVPVGTLVPVGYYDRAQGAWSPSPNGIVLQVLGSTNGIALLDLHGAGQAETVETLAANGFTTEELQRLALLYPAGKTLWRAPVPHCSDWDFNFGKSPPGNNKRNRPGDKPKKNPHDKSKKEYGTLNFSAQTFTEQIPLVGVPFALNYSSARVPDYRVDDQITIPVAWQSPPSPCIDLGTCAIPPHYFDPPTGIRVEMDIEGQQSVQSLPGTNATVTVSWDGRNAYGQLVGDTRLATIDIAYEYGAWDYFGVSGGPELQAMFPALFGNSGNMLTFTAHSASGIGVGVLFQRLLIYPDHRKLGLGGWSPDPLHRLDPTGGLLYYGDGRIRQVPERSLEQDSLSGLQGIGNVAAAAPDGSLYFYGMLGSPPEWYLFRRNPAGNHELVSASRLTSGTVRLITDGWAKADGLPADRVVMDLQPQSMSVGPDGSLYVATTDARIARLTPDGIWHVVLGLNAASAVLVPDGTPAAASLATYVNNVVLAVGPDSSVYYSSSWPSYAPNANGRNYSMIRKIAPDGRIYTVFGGGGVAATMGSPSFKTLFGTAAYAAPYHNWSGVWGLAVGNDGTVYVSENEQSQGGIFKISPGGMILPFLNGGPTCAEGQLDPIPGNPSITAQIKGDQGKLATAVTNLITTPTCLQVARDGSVYFVGGVFVWRVNPNGIVERVAGRYTQSYLPPVSLPLDHGDPLNTYIHPVVAMALTPDGALALVNTSFNSPGMVPVLTILGRASLNGTLAAISAQIIPSEDGMEAYAFDSAGRHLGTVDGLTGATKWAFGYDANSLVVSLTNLAGQVTTIERDASGQATAIIGPYGQRTSLTMDANGFLSAVTNLAGETTLLSNSSGGLLQAITGPRGETFTVAYDDLGRVTNVADPLGGGWTDALSDKGVFENSSYEVDVNCTNSLGDTLSRQMLLQPNGDTHVISSFGGHPTETTISRLNGDTSSSFGDGSTLYVGMGPDPRFGNQAVGPVSCRFSLPNGLVYNATFHGTVGLTNATDPLSLKGATNVTKINGHTYTETYSAANRTIAFTTPTGRSAAAVLDAQARLVHLAGTGAPTIDAGYDDAGRLAFMSDTGAAGVAQTTFSYDGLGRLGLVTDPVGRTNALAYDAAGRIRQLTMPDGSVCSFTFDSEDDLTSVTPPGRPAHTFQYDAVGSLTKYIPPLVGGDESVICQYDSERNLTNLALPDGQAVTFMRGLDGRVEQLTLGAGTTLTYQYGTNNGSEFLLPISMSSSSGDVLQLGYLGSILTNVAWSGAITGKVSVQLNSDLLPASESVNGSTLALSYNADQLLSQAGRLSVIRDPATGFITGTTVGGVTDQRQFDDRGLLTNYTARVNGTVIWSYALSFDPAKRLVNKVETIGGATRAYGYVYDLAGRLQQVWQDGSLATIYTYDSNGNRLARNSEQATYDAQDRVLTYAGAAFGWSPNGSINTRTSGGQTTTYAYDVRGALTSVDQPSGEQIHYVIDALGRRIAKRVNGVLQRGWLWDANRVLAEVDGGSSLAARFVYGADDSTPSYMIAGTNIYRLLSDERGSARLVVNVSDGSVLQQLDYDEFGRVLSDSNPGFQPFGFAGGVYDPDTGLVRFGARDYSSETGQWTARDPVLFAGGQYSLYAYVNNDPINLLDPLGTGPFSKYFRQLADNYEKYKNQAWDWAKSQALEKAVEELGYKAVTQVIEIADKSATLAGELVNSTTGNALGKAQREAKQAGNIQGPNSKMRPYTGPLDYYRSLFRRR